MKLGPSEEPAGRTRRFIPTDRAVSEGLFAPAHSRDLVRSRRLLVDVLRALEPHREALTVVGAHAVLERTKELEPYLVSDSTRDADLGVTPQLLGGVPVLASTLHDLGLEEASPARPGVWGLVAEHDPARLRTKDAGDNYRVMATSDPEVVREVFRQGEQDPAIAASVRTGYERVLLIREPLIDLAVRHFRGVFDERTVVDAMSDWLDDFTAG